MTFAPQFIPLPYMNTVITDSHFKQRDRMGRLDTFLARLYQNGSSSNPFGIGIDEVTNIAVDQTGAATMFGNGTAYLVHLSSPVSIVCQSKTPLSVNSLEIVRLDATKGDTFNFVTGANTGVKYSLTITNGVIMGPPYGP